MTTEPSMTAAISFLEDTVRQLNAAIQYRVDAAINFAPQIHLSLSDLVDNCNGNVLSLFQHIFSSDSLILVAENHGFKRGSSSSSSTLPTDIFLDLHHWQSFDPAELTIVTNSFRILSGNSGSDSIYLPFPSDIVPQQQTSPPSSHTPQQQTSPIQPPLIDMMEATLRYAQAEESVNELDGTIARLQLEIATMVESERRKEDQITHIYNSQVAPNSLLLYLYHHEHPLAFPHSTYSSFHFFPYCRHRQWPHKSPHKPWCLKIP